MAILTAATTTDHSLPTTNKSRISKEFHSAHLWVRKIFSNFVFSNKNKKKKTQQPKRKNASFWGINKWMFDIICTSSSSSYVGEMRNNNVCTMQTKRRRDASCQRQKKIKRVTKTILNWKKQQTTNEFLNVKCDATDRENEREGERLPLHLFVQLWNCGWVVIIFVAQKTTTTMRELDNACVLEEGGGGFMLGKHLVGRPAART